MECRGSTYEGWREALLPVVASGHLQRGENGLHHQLQ